MPPRRSSTMRPQTSPNLLTLTRGLNVSSVFLWGLSPSITTPSPDITTRSPDDDLAHARRQTHRSGDTSEPGENHGCQRHDSTPGVHKRIESCKADDALTLLTVASGETKVNSLSRPLLAHNFTRPTFRFQITRPPKPVVRVEDLTAPSPAASAALQTAISITSP